MKESVKETYETLEQKNKQKQQIKVYSSAVIFSFIVGFSFLGVKTCLQWASPLLTLAYRYDFAFLSAVIFLLIGRSKLGGKRKRKDKLLITSGFYIVFMVLQAIGLVFATSVESGIIFAVIPILAKLIARIALKETTNWKQNIFVCLSVAAVILMFVFGATDIHVNFISLIILFLSSLCMAISNVYMRYVRAEYSPMEIAFYIALLGFIVFNLAAIVQCLKNGTLADYLVPSAHVSFLIATAYLGIPSTFISSLIMSYMLAHMEAVKATIFGNLSTAISIVVGVLILNEPLKLYHILCTLLIIVGVVGVSLPAMANQTTAKKVQN